MHTRFPILSPRATLASVVVALVLAVNAVSARAAGVDVVYLADESGSLDATSFVRQQNFLIEVTNAVNETVPFGPEGLAAGLVAHSGDARSITNPTFLFSTFASGVVGMVQRGGQSCLSCAIGVGSDLLVSRGRLDAPDVLVLLGDGNTVSVALLATRAASARARGHAIVGIAVGGSRDVDDAISGIVSSPADFFAIPDWSRLGNLELVDDVAERILARVAPIPEPGTLGLLAAGLAGLVMLRRRRAA